MFSETSAGSDEHAWSRSLEGAGVFWRAVKSKLARGERSIVLAAVSKSRAPQRDSFTRYRAPCQVMLSSLATKQKVGSHLAWLSYSLPPPNVCVCRLYTATHCSPPPDCPPVRPPPPPHPLPSSSTNPTNILTASFMHSRFRPNPLISAGKEKNKKEPRERKREEEEAAIQDT